MRDILRAVEPCDQANAHTQAYWASAIRASWQKSITGIIETGIHLLEARSELERGVFNAMVMRLPFGPRTAQRLMAIAANPILSSATHVSTLPPSWGTLYELSKLPSDVLLAKIEDGAVRPDMERREVAALLDRPKKPAPPKPPDLLLAAWPDSSVEVRRLLFDRIPRDELLALISAEMRAGLTELFERQLAAKAKVSKVNLKNVHGTLSAALQMALSLLNSIDAPNSTEIVRKANTYQLLNALRTLNNAAGSGKEVAIAIVDRGTIETLRNPHTKKRRAA